MSRYKVRADRSYTWRGWIYLGANAEVLSTEEGFVDIELRDDCARVWVHIGVRIWEYRIIPAPTKEGLHRMAKRLLRETVEKAKAKKG